ncbi:MAG: zinc ribbon domain-containing protein, partial [Dehalococcoidia bacterium]|nr:zinc ribbon domain-containing protein [Dehalococcoidia bacterium]
MPAWTRPSAPTRASRSPTGSVAPASDSWTRTSRGGAAAMPIYEYRCEKCERVSSVFVRSAKAEVKPKCEHCGSTRMKRLMSRVQRTR